MGRWILDCQNEASQEPAGGALFLVMLLVAGWRFSAFLGAGTGGQRGQTSVIAMLRQQTQVTRGGKASRRQNETSQCRVSNARNNQARSLPTKGVPLEVEAKAPSSQGGQRQVAVYARQKP